jgi:hypothetical protein
LPSIPATLVSADYVFVVETFNDLLKGDAVGTEMISFFIVLKIRGREAAPVNHDTSLSYHPRDYREILERDGG